MRGEDRGRKWRRSAVALLCCGALLFATTNCHTKKIAKIDVAQAPSVAHDRLVGVTTKDGQDVRFDEPGGVIAGDQVTANVNRTAYSIPLSQVQRLWVERRGISTVRTIGLAVGIAMAAVGTLAIIVALTKESCPFVYSWDGKQYVFDAEPYGGAIARALERDDYSELENLKAEHGEYRLLMTNEVDETQHTNLAELWVVDHAPGTRVVADNQGRLYGFRKLERLESANDRAGHDITRWLEATDRRVWEPEAKAAADGSAREEIVLSFAKPEGALTANLVVNAATTLWGSYMIKKMVQLRGRSAAQWLNSLGTNPIEMASLGAWYSRDELYNLKIDIEEGSGWMTRGAVMGGGPFIAEDRVVPLDIRGVTGGHLRIRLRPPLGFWALNSFAVSYEDAASPAPQVVKIRAARTSSGADVLAELAASDGLYYSMPDMSESAEMRFPAPPPMPAMTRTIFLHSRGWYELHLTGRGEADTAALNEIYAKPDAAARFAAREFANWHPVP
ncbi:MAG TPA: hypothetical protein VLY04_10375 [Bryobacteraceae bacterium]|nr:hypothetical protein [Bryobacteraceae bacterium]